MLCLAQQIVQVQPNASTGVTAAPQSMKQALETMLQWCSTSMQSTSQFAPKHEQKLRGCIELCFVSSHADYLCHYLNNKLLIPKAQGPRV